MQVHNISRYLSGEVMSSRFFSSDKCLCCKELGYSCADESALQLPGSRAANGPLPPLLPVTEDTVCAINNTKLAGLSLDTLAPLVIKSWKQILSSGESPRLTWDQPIKTLGSRAGNHGIPVHGGSWGKGLGYTGLSLHSAHDMRGFVAVSP